MSDERKLPPGQTDWSKGDVYLNKERPTPLVAQPKAYPVAMPTGQGDVDDVISGALLPKEGEESEGFLMKFKKGLISRKAAGQELEARYKGRLEVIKHGVSQMVRVKNAEIDVQVGVYLAKLEAEHLKVATELGITNSGYRDDALRRLAVQSSAAFKRAMEEDLHDKIKERLLNDILALHEREHNKIMQELGGSV